ncbi:MAG: sulfite exporter TauE/SafE family protein [Gammaproteobacteria bacterium]|nr:MAG: sulfite exporter TauE/SafE family protein [Gammaproteobacteria bacterium]
MANPDVLALYLLLGAFAGTMAGLLGIGGGLIIVPALAAIYVSQNLPGDIIMHLALGTSLATIVITSISSVRSHHRHQAVLWPVAARLAPGILIGAWLGGWLAGQLTTAWLKPIFGVFEILVALHLLSGKQVEEHERLPGPLIMNSAGGVIGTISAIVGIGGGTLTVPFLVWHGTAIRKAIATSAACGLPIAISGSLSYAVAGWGNPQLPDHVLGYIHLPAFVGIVLTSALFAPLGARLTHRLPVQLLKKIFAVFLLLVAAKLLTSEF